MPSFIRFLLPFLIILGSGLIAGCSMSGQKTTSIPWDQPANWEGQIPGMDMSNSH
ncbi:MAG: hypothetical protein ACREFX_13040 [Opitutaceae bacterium]